MGTEITFSCGDFHNFYSQVYETMKVPPPTFKYLKWLSTFLKTHYSNILQYWRRPDLHILFFRKPLLSTWKELAHKCDNTVDICCFGFLTISSSFCTSPPVFLAEISSARLHVVLGVLSLFCIRDGSITRTTN